MTLHCICPECKNPIDLSVYTDVKPGMTLECQTCGMTLEVMDITSEGTVTTEIVDEGK